MTLIMEDDYGLLPPHIQSEASYSPTLPHFLTLFLLLEVIAIFFIPSWLSNPIAWVMVGLSLPVLAWLLFRCVVIQLVFTAPEPVVKKLVDPRWSPFRYVGWGSDVKTAYLLEVEGAKDDLVVVLHGRGSSFCNVESRALHIAELGTNVVGFNLRGHGGCDRRKDWTLLKVVDDIEAMLESLEYEFGENLPERIWFYGHSVGGFLSIWLGANPSGWWKNRLAGLILESPATSFPLAVESLLPPYLRAFRPWVRQILRREHERIHPDLSISYATAQVPHFGMPVVPVLVMQAMRDNRLGREHYNLLTSHLGDGASIHLLSSQPHTSKVDSEERRQILEMWLKPRLGEVMEGLI